MRTKWGPWQMCKDGGREMMRVCNPGAGLVETEVPGLAGQPVLSN